MSRPPSPWPHLGTQRSLQLQAQAGHSPLRNTARASVGVAGVPALSGLCTSPVSVLSLRLASSGKHPNAKNRHPRHARAKNRSSQHCAMHWKVGVASVAVGGLATNREPRHTGAQEQKPPAPCHALAAEGGWPPTATHAGEQKQEPGAPALWGHSSPSTGKTRRASPRPTLAPVVDGASGVVSCYPLVVWALCCKQAGYSSVGRASDCRALQLSDGPWFDSGWPDFREPAQTGAAATLSLAHPSSTMRPIYCSTFLV